MELKLLGADGSAGSVVVNPDIFSRDYNEPLVHQVITAYQANARRGTRAQKDRGAVKHSTRKPFRQKGTGRARAGMTSSPLWRGGGQIFPNSADENFSQKINKKMFRAGLCSIFSQLAREGRVSVIDEIVLEAPKTGFLAKKLKTLGLTSVLLITEGFNENLFLAARNLPNVLVVEPCYADPLSLVFYKNIVITRSALAKIEEILA